MGDPDFANKSLLKPFDAVNKPRFVVRQAVLLIN